MKDEKRKKGKERERRRVVKTHCPTNDVHPLNRRPIIPPCTAHFLALSLSLPFTHSGHTLFSHPRLFPSASFSFFFLSVGTRLPSFFSDSFRFHFSFFLFFFAVSFLSTSPVAFANTPRLVPNPSGR